MPSLFTLGTIKLPHVGSYQDHCAPHLEETFEETVIIQQLINYLRDYMLSISAIVNTS